MISIRTPTPGLPDCCRDVVKIPGSALNEKQVIEQCVAHLPSGFVPQAAVFTDSIPRDLGGNVNGSKLRAQFSGLVG